MLMYSAWVRTDATRWPPQIPADEQRQKEALVDYICSVAESSKPTVRAPCPHDCCHVPPGSTVQVFTLTELVLHWFHSHWHQGSVADVAPTAPPAQQATSSLPGSGSRTAAHGSGPASSARTAAAGVSPALASSQSALQQVEASIRAEVAVQRVELAAARARQQPSAGEPPPPNTWARAALDDGAAAGRSAIRANWQGSGAMGTQRRQPRLARKGEAELFADVQDKTDGGSAADIFCAVFSAERFELFGAGPDDDTESDPELTRHTGDSEHTVGTAVCSASTLGWAQADGGSYKVWVACDDCQAASTPYKIVLRIGDDKPCVYEGSWLAGSAIDEMLAFDFSITSAPQLQIGTYDRVAFPHHSVKVSDLWSLARSAPAQVDLLMVQLNSEGEYMEHGQLDSKNTRTEWRRADRAGQKQSDLSPWRLTGETALQSWPEANDRNHSISVNLDYVAPDVHSLVFVARARGAASGPVEVPQVVLLAPKDGEKGDSLLGTFSCPAESAAQLAPGSAVVMCRFFRERVEPADDEEWQAFESYMFEQPQPNRPRAVRSDQFHFNSILIPF